VRSKGANKKKCFNLSTGGGWPVMVGKSRRRRRRPFLKASVFTRIDGHLIKTTIQYLTHKKKTTV